jgi:hypothetical protein
MWAQLAVDRRAAAAEDVVVVRHHCDLGNHTACGCGPAAHCSEAPLDVLADERRRVDELELNRYAGVVRACLVIAAAVVVTDELTVTTGLVTR